MHLCPLLHIIALTSPEELLSTERLDEAALCCEKLRTHDTIQAEEVKWFATASVSTAKRPYFYHYMHAGKFDQVTVVYGLLILNTPLIPLSQTYVGSFLSRFVFLYTAL